MKIKKRHRTQLVEVLSQGWLFVISFFKKKSLCFSEGMLFSPIQAGQSQSSGRKKILLALPLPSGGALTFVLQTKMSWQGRFGSLFYFDTSRTWPWGKKTKLASIRPSATISWRDKRCQKDSITKFKLFIHCFSQQEETAVTHWGSQLWNQPLLKRFFLQKKAAP